MENQKSIRVLIAKPGLDGHDRGAKVVAHALKEAGMEVIYTGLHRTVDQIVRIAIQEDVDIIGLSIMSGAHVPIVEKLMKKVGEEGIGEKMVIVGGVIPNQDVSRLKASASRAFFPAAPAFPRSWLSSTSAWDGPRRNNGSCKIYKGSERPDHGRAAPVRHPRETGLRTRRP